MKLTIAPHDLKEAIRYANTVINKRHSSPIMAGLLLEAADGRLRAFGATYEAHAAVTMPAQVAEDGRVLVNGALIGQAVGKLRGSKPATLAVNEKALVISQGRVVFSIQLMPIDRYPNDLDKPLPVVGHVDGEKFARMIHEIEGAASDDYARPALTGVEIAGKAGQLMAVATDTYRLAISEIEWEPADETEPSWLVPAEWLRHAIKSVAADTTIHSDGTAFAITSGDYTTCTNTRDGDYPKVRALFKNTGRETYRVNREEFAEAADAAGVMAESLTPIKITGSENEVISLTAGNDMGAGVAQLKTDNAEPFEVGINPKFLNWALRALDAETIHFTPQGSKPIHITAPSTNTQYLIMPIRLTNQ